MANNFNYYSPTEVVFGKGTHAQTGAYVKKYGGTKLLIVYGSDRVLKNGVMDAVTESVKTEGITYELLGGVVPNPHLSKVYRARQENGSGFCTGSRWRICHRYRESDFLWTGGAGRRCVDLICTYKNSKEILACSVRFNDCGSRKRDK